MPRTNIGIDINAKDNASGEIRKVGGSLDSLDKSTQRSNSGLSQFSGRLAGLANPLALAGGAIAGVGAALIANTQRYLENAHATTLMAQEAGIGVEAFSRLTEASEVLGVEQDTLRDIIFDTQLAISEATAEAGAQREALQQLGLSYIELNNLSPEEQLYAIVDALNAGAGGANTMAIAAQLLGEGTLRDLNPILAEGSAGMRQLADEASEAGTVLTEEAAAAAEDARRDMLRLNQSLEGIGNTIAEAMIPALADLAEGALPVVNESIARTIQFANAFSQAFIGAQARVFDLSSALRIFSRQGRFGIYEDILEGFGDGLSNLGIGGDIQDASVPPFTRSFARGRGSVADVGSFYLDSLPSHFTNPPPPRATQSREGSLVSLGLVIDRLSNAVDNYARDAAALVAVNQERDVSTRELEVGAAQFVDGALQVDLPNRIYGSGGGVRIDGEDLLVRSQEIPMRVLVAGFGGLNEQAEPENAQVFRFENGSGDDLLGAFFALMQQGLDTGAVVVRQ